MVCEKGWSAVHVYVSSRTCSCLPACFSQIDLTDDYVVTSIFGDGTWERTIQKVQGKDDDGKMQDARMDQESFRDLISIME